MPNVASTAPAMSTRSSVVSIERARHHNLPHRFERERPNGALLEVRGAPMPSGGFVTTYSDISSRREAEAEVKRSAALMRGAIDAIGEAFVLYDAEDRLVFCNDKYREIYRPSAGVAGPGNALRGHHPRRCAHRAHSGGGRPDRGMGGRAAGGIPGRECNLHPAAR